MIAALAYLQWHSFRNQLATRFKRLRQPKYLVGAVVGGFYMYFYFFRYLFMGHAGSGKHISFLAAPENQLLIELGGALVLFVIVLAGWIFASGKPALHFTETEVAFLFPAPISRRQLIQYRVLRSQVAILISAFFLTLVSRRFGGNVICHALGWWLILATLGLNTTASSFARAALADHGLSNRWRRWATLAVLAVLALAVWYWARAALPPWPGTSDFTALKNYAQQALASGPLLYLLYPFRLVVRPFLAPDAATFALVSLPALAIYLGHYFWVINSGVAFEEASATAAQRMGVVLAAARSGNLRSLRKRKKPGRPWFQLAPTGPALLALMWKNFLGVTQVINARVVISLSIIIVIFAVAFGGSAGHQATSIAASIIIGMILLYSLLLGPQILRLDFRADLPMADVLKTYPLRGWQISLGEILAPTVVLAGIQWLVLLVGAFLVFFLHQHPARLFLAIGLGAALVLPPLDGVLLIIQNTAAVLFPAWFQSGKDSPKGIEVTGQRLIMGLAQMLVMLLSLIPAALAFAVIFYPAQMFVSPAVAIPPAAFVAALVVAGEAALGIVWLGKCFDRFDVAGDPAT